MTTNRYKRGALPNQNHSDMLRTIIANEKIFNEKVEEVYKVERINKRTY